MAEQLKPLKAELKRIESELGAHEAERTALEQELAQATLPPQQRAEQGRRLKTVGDAIAVLEERWLAASERIEALQAPVD
jgi:ATP-binding cassette subfamily F protein 3